MNFSRILAIIVALVAVGIGLVTTCLPRILERLLALDPKDFDQPGLERLRIGHAMAGGGNEGIAFLSDALKTTLWQRIFGWVRSTRSRTAWRRLMHTLRDAEVLYLSPRWGFGLGPPGFASQEIAEGLRYVSAVVRLALEAYTEDQPRMVRMVSPTLKMLGDNPDAQYYMASLQSWGRKEPEQPKAFLVTGCRGRHEVYLSFSVHAPSTEGVLERVVTDLNDNALNLDDRGCYQLYLSPTHPGTEVLQSLGDGRAVSPTWLETPPEATTLVSRHYFRTPPGTPPGAVSERVTVSIELVGGAAENGSPSPIDDAAMAERIDRATDFVRRHTLDMPMPDPTTAPPFFALTPNAIGIPQKWQRQTEGMGAVDIAYAAGRFLLRPNEALVLEGAVPACRFANVVIWNRFLQTLDYSSPDHPVHLTLDTPNEGEAPVPFRILVSATRPHGYEGWWMHTEGRETGTIFFRFLLPEEDEYPPVTAKVVRIQDVASTPAAF